MYCNLDTDNKVVVKEAERTEGPAEKANDVRKPGKEIEKVREIWRSSGVVPRIRICINRPLSRGWFIESSGGVCRCESRWLWKEDRLKESNNVCWARR